MDSGNNAFYARELLKLTNLLLCQNGTTLLEPSYTSINQSVLVLHGNPGDSGIYTCRWNNSFGEATKNFSVHYDEGPKGVDTNVIIAIGVTVSVIVIAGIAIGIKLYLDKVRKQIRSKYYYFLDTFDLNLKERTSFPWSH